MPLIQRLTVISVLAKPDRSAKSPANLAKPIRVRQCLSGDADNIGFASGKYLFCLLEIVNPASSNYRCV